MSSSEDQLVSFFLYSFIVYPITGYLTSSARSYPKWRGALYAILFLVSVALLHHAYENTDKSPNFYQLLNVTRDSTTSELKKSYRHLSVTLHPDKNKAANAEEQFLRVKLAYDVIGNSETKRAYNLLGETGAKIAAKSTLDLKYILVQMIVYYGSSLLYAFFLTFSESTGEAMTTSVYGLSVMLLIESILLIEEWKIPSFLFPYHTSHDILQWLHRLYPVFINCARVVTGAFHVDRRADVSKRLLEIWENVRSNKKHLVELAEQIRSAKISASQVSFSPRYIDDVEGSDEGIMALVMKEAETACKTERSNERKTSENGPKPSQSNYNLLFFRNLGIYIALTYAYSIYKSRK